MRIRFGYREVPPPAGRLRLPDGATPDPRRHALADGYARAYRRLAAAGPGLLAPGGPLHGCADVRVRLVQLSTFLYVRLLLESWLPDALRDAAERERGLDRLAVPVFEFGPGGRDLWLDDGRGRPASCPSRRWRFLFPDAAAVRAAHPVTAARLDEAVDVPLSANLTERDRDHLVAAVRRVMGVAAGRP